MSFLIIAGAAFAPLACAQVTNQVHGTGGYNGYTPPQRSASMALDPSHPDFEAFDDLFQKGGKCVQDGDMPRALGYFEQALTLDPDNVQTKKMVTRMATLGITAIYSSDDGSTFVDVAASEEGEADAL